MTLKLQRKQQILEQHTGQLRKTLDELRESIEQAKNRMIDAPGAMQSHHDTTKIETGWLIDGLVKRRKAVENTLSVLTEIASVMQSREFDHVLSGALVTLEHLNDVLRFFIVPDGEGSNVKIDEWDITLMSPTAPICSQLLGKEVGDTILFRGKEFVISEIE